MNKKTRAITYSAIFLAFGLIIPSIFHLFGGAGPIFLPMHIPVLLAGLFLGGEYGGIIGLLTVLLNSFITGMPQEPILYFMLVEVTLYGFLAGISYNSLKLSIYPSLIISMVLGRIGLAITVFGLQSLLGFNLSPSAYFIGALTSGIPGMIIQLIFIPIVVKTIERAGYKLK